MDETVIEFNGTKYTEANLQDLSDDQLLELRNLVASNLGVATVRGFKDHDAAVTGAWKALERYQKTVDEEAGEASEATGEEEKPKAKKPKKAKEPKEPKDKPLAKSAEAKNVKRPTRKMFAEIKKTGEHDGSQGRQHRWGNYRDGMLMIEVHETEGTEPWDVYNWQSQGIMDVIEPTDEQYAERRDAWYKTKGLEDPEAAKQRKAEEREKAKAEREAAKAERERVKAEADAAKKAAEAEAEAANTSEQAQA